MSNVLPQLAQRARTAALESPFFSRLDECDDAKTMGTWMRQLYHQSREFTSALALRSAACRNPRHRAAFTRHAAEEALHPDELVEWMRANGFLGRDEDPNDVRPVLDTLNVSTYCIRLVLRGSVAEQVVAMNLVSEGMAYDFFSRAIPALHRLEVDTGSYWHVHEEVDLEHLEIGSDFIEDETSLVDVVGDMGTLYRRMYDTWARLWVAPRAA